MNIPEDKPVYPISAAQRTLRWSEMFSLEPYKVKENNIISFYMRVSESCDIEALEHAFNELMKNNDSLRLRMFRTARGIRQYIKDFVYTEIPRIEVDGDAGFEAFLADIHRYRILFFDECLVWARLIIRRPGDCTLVMRIHHAAIDGYSIRLVMERLEKYYECFHHGEPPETQKAYSILKYFDMQERYAKSTQHKADRKYWFHLYNHQRRYSFPAGHRSEFGDCALEKITIDNETYLKLQSLADQTSSTLQSLLMTLAAVTTYVVTGKENFSIFSLTHGRLNYALKNTIGCMMNTVPIFYDLKHATPLQLIIEECYLTYLDTLSHGRLPLGEQVPMSYIEAVKHFFNFNHGWLLFSYMEYGDLFAHSSYEMNMINPTNQAHQFYLTMLDVRGDHLEFELGYQTRKFKPQTVRMLLETYSFVIHCAADQPQWDIDMIQQEYKRRSMS